MSALVESVVRVTATIYEDLIICDECQPERLKSLDLSQSCASPNCGEDGFGNAAAVVSS